jgi:hypothetical protein
MSRVHAYKCDELDENGNECGLIFESYDSLRAHRNSNAHR